MEDRLFFLITCEHGGSLVPEEFAGLFAGRQDMLASHAGWDPGALQLAKALHRAAGDAIVFSTVTRLLVDLNRSLGHPKLFSHISKPLDTSAKKQILARYYSPHRKKVEDLVKGAADKGCRVVHIACHTFTPILNGNKRLADVGLLYDPAREAEKIFCLKWQKLILEDSPTPIKVRRNYPYKGTSDGLATALRRVHGQGRYLGVELEVNQGPVAQSPPLFHKQKNILAKTLLMMRSLLGSQKP